jgi:hypothetical protein
VPAAVLDDASLLQPRRTFGNRFAPYTQYFSNSLLGDEYLIAFYPIESTRQEAAEALFDGVVSIAHSELRGLRDQREYVAQKQMLQRVSAVKFGEQISYRNAIREASKLHVRSAI